MPRRPALGPRPAQRLLPFLERSRRLDRRFKRAIALGTVLVIAGLTAGTGAGRYAVGWVTAASRLAFRRAIGAEPEQAEVAELVAVKRDRTEQQTRDRLEHFYGRADPAIRRLFDAAGMDPAAALIGSGRANNAFLLSSKVFAPDDHGRSFRLRPGVRSVWLRQVTLHEGPFGLFLVPDEPEVRAAAVAAGAIVDEGSIQTTNSWGCRGPEPDPAASVRGIVIGDSFMMGMFNGDDDTPPLVLQRDLADRLGQSVSILNTGHIGYAPEQYCATLREYGERFPPDFVVVSVCPNDFGDEFDVMAGRGDDWAEAEFWLGEIVQWCRAHQALIVLAVVPCDHQLDVRKDAGYPGRISNLFHAGPAHYLCPIEAFLDETLRLRVQALRGGPDVGPRPLYNQAIHDNHFSPRGARLWAESVGRRVALLLESQGRPRGHRPSR